jgi:hypothetical protein
VQRLPQVTTAQRRVLAACAQFLVNNWGAAFISSGTISSPIRSTRPPPLPTTTLNSSGAASCFCPRVQFSSARAPVRSSATRPTVAIRHHGKRGSYEYLLKGLQLTGLSQANIYGHDCNPSTNDHLGPPSQPQKCEIFYARTYHFSTRAVSTPNAPQSAHFSTAHIPLGHELCVVANGISSHCVPFGHHHPERPCGCYDCQRQEAACTCH